MINIAIISELFVPEASVESPLFPLRVRNLNSLSDDKKAGLKLNLSWVTLTFYLIFLSNEIIVLPKRMKTYLHFTNQSFK